MVACVLWTRKNNTYAERGRWFGWYSGPICLDACLETLTCVAVDTGPGLGCIMHHNVDDLTQMQPRFGVTHFVLDRQCLSAVTTGINR